LFFSEQTLKEGDLKGQKMTPNQNGPIGLLGIKLLKKKIREGHAKLCISPPEI
jgi:hypothetical protein